MSSIQGSSSAWRATLQSLQRDFRRAAEKYPNVRHAVVQALDEEQSIPPSLENEMLAAGGWSVGVMRGRWELTAGNDASSSYMEWLRWNSPAKVGYLYGDPAGRKRFEHLAECGWLALPGTRDGKSQAFPQPRLLERWMAFIYRQIDDAASPYLGAEDVLWVAEYPADGQLVERRYDPCAVTNGNIVSTGYPDADGLSNRSRRWLYTSLATGPFTVSAVAIDLLLADPDPEGPRLVSWQEMDAYMKGPFQNANFLVDYIILANGKRFPVYRRDCKPVLGTKPSICPSAEPKPPVRLRPSGEMMADLEKRFRELRLVVAGEETIHWVGRQTTVETTCICYLSNPQPGPASVPTGQSECKMTTWTNYDQLSVQLLSILTDTLPLPRWDDDKRHEQQIAIAVCEATGITPEHWDKLDHSSREPLLERTLHLRTNSSASPLNALRLRPPSSPDSQPQTRPTDEPYAAANGQRVELRSRDESPIVLGKEKPPLTERQYNVVKALLDAGKRGLSKDKLDEKSGHSEARKVLRVLRDSDVDWAAVIHMPGKAGRGGYRIK